MFPEWTWILGVLLGATIGSFLNVVIYRTPRGMSLSNPKHSFCPSCKHQLGPLDLFPLFSWLASRGRCRHCKEKVPARYFLVELLNGAIWGGIWYRFLVQPTLMPGAYAPAVATALAYAAASATLVAIIFIDWEMYIIPDELNAALLIVGIAFHAYMGTWMIALKGALLGWGLLWGIALLGRLLFQKDAMGHGDIKMMRGVGALLGPALLAISLGLAVVSGLVIGLILIAVEAQIRKASVAEGEAVDEGEVPDDKEPIGSLLGWGVAYLLCVDAFAAVIPPLGRWIEKQLPEGQAEDPEDDWQPSLTTIPFGPYLAIGAIACMLFGGQLLGAFESYWRHATEPTALLRAVPSKRLEHLEAYSLRSRWTDKVERTVIGRQ